MAKITDFKNPITNPKGNILDVTDWIGAIWWVVFFGTTFAIGAKVVNILDQKIPGDQTPNLNGYAQPPKVNSVTVL